MYRASLRLFAATVLIALAASANAATINTNGDSLVSITDVVIGNKTVDVTFDDGPAADAYGPFPGTLPASSEAVAVLITNTVNDILNAEGLTSVQDGDSGNTSTRYRVGFETSESGAIQFIDVIQGTYGAEWSSTGTPPPLQTYTIDLPDHYLVLSEQVTAVPLPAAAWLFGSGLIGLIGIARKKRAA